MNSGYGPPPKLTKWPNYPRAQSTIENINQNCPIRGISSISCLTVNCRAGYSASRRAMSNEHVLIGRAFLLIEDVRHNRKYPISQWEILWQWRLRLGWLRLGIHGEVLRVEDPEGKRRGGFYNQWKFETRKIREEWIVTVDVVAIIDEFRCFIWEDEMLNNVNFIDLRKLGLQCDSQRKLLIWFFSLNIETRASSLRTSKRGLDSLIPKRTAKSSPRFMKMILT